MLKINVRAAIRMISIFAKRHAPAITTAIGIGAGAATVVMAVSATKQAVPKLEEKKKELGKDKLSVTETIETAGSCYILTAIVGGISIACLIAGSTQSARRNAALMAAYNVAEKRFKEYREHVVQEIGQKRESEVCDSIDRERVCRNPPDESDVAFVEGSGRTLCYDAMFGGYFYSDIETIRQAANRLNHQMNTMCETYISLNQFFSEIGRKTIEVGDMLGWNVDKGLIEISFSSQLAGGRTPCLVMSYDVIPGYDYY